MTASIFALCSPIESSGEELDSDGDQSDDEEEDEDEGEDAFGSLGSDAVAMSVTPDDAVWVPSLVVPVRFMSCGVFSLLWLSSMSALVKFYVTFYAAETSCPAVDVLLLYPMRCPCGRFLCLAHYRTGLHYGVPA